MRGTFSDIKSFSSAFQHLHQSLSTTSSKSTVELDNNAITSLFDIVSIVFITVAVTTVTVTTVATVTTSLLVTAINILEVESPAIFDDVHEKISNSISVGDFCVLSTVVLLKETVEENVVGSRILLDDFLVSIGNNIDIVIDDLFVNIVISHRNVDVDIGIDIVSNISASSSVSEESTRTTVSASSADSSVEHTRNQSVDVVILISAFVTLHHTVANLIVLREVASLERNVINVFLVVEVLALGNRRQSARNSLSDSSLGAWLTNQDERNFVSGLTVWIGTFSTLPVSTTVLLVSLVSPERTQFDVVGRSGVRQTTLAFVIHTTSSCFDVAATIGVVTLVIFAVVASSLSPSSLLLPAFIGTRTAATTAAAAASLSSSLSDGNDFPTEPDFFTSAFCVETHIGVVKCATVQIGSTVRSATRFVLLLAAAGLFVGRTTSANVNNNNFVALGVFHIVVGLVVFTTNWIVAAFLATIETAVVVVADWTVVVAVVVVLVRCGVFFEHVDRGNGSTEKCHGEEGRFHL